MPHIIIRATYSKLALELLQKLVFLTIAIVTIQPSLYATPSKASLFMPAPKNLSIYNQDINSLNYRERQLIFIHGLRNAPLDPTIWGIRKDDRTENRHLTPMRPLYLRTSEDKDFSLNSVEFDFKFSKASKKYMRQVPERKDPVFEIGFAGEYEFGLRGQHARKDLGYALRLTAVPYMKNGFYFQRNKDYHRVSKCEQKNIEAGKLYRARLEVHDKNALFYLDDQLFCQLTATTTLKKGLVSLRTSWHPLTLQNLSIHAENSDQKMIISGLIKPKNKNANKKKASL